VDAACVVKVLSGKSLNRSIVTRAHAPRQADEHAGARAHAASTNVGDGISAGASSVADGIWDGVTGVFVKPMQGAVDGGVGGFASGLSGPRSGVSAASAFHIVYRFFVWRFCMGAQGD
jgi:hypothetical protein